MFNSPKPDPEHIIRQSPIPVMSDAKRLLPLPHDALHSDKLFGIKERINALKSGERFTEDVDAACFNEIWVAYINETRNHRQGGLGKLQIDYIGGTMTVINIEPRKPQPAPVDPVEPDSPVFPEPDER